MRARGRVASLLLALAPAPFASADDGAQLAALLDRMVSFRAGFEQVVTSRFGEALQNTTGQMHLRRPNQLRWEVDEPYPQLVLADGQSLWVFDPDLNQASVQPLAAAIAGSPAMFLAGTAADLASHFVVRAVEPPATGGFRFRLEPRDSESVFRELMLSFSTAGVLTGLDIADHLDQFTRIVFTGMELNPTLEPGLFKFQAPEGVDIIEAAPDRAQRAPG